MSELGPYVFPKPPVYCVRLWKQHLFLASLGGSRNFLSNGPSRSAIRRKVLENCIVKMYERSPPMLPITRQEVSLWSVKKRNSQFDVIAKCVGPRKADQSGYRQTCVTIGLGKTYGFSAFALCCVEDTRHTERRILPHTIRRRNAKANVTSIDDSDRPQYHRTGTPKHGPDQPPF